MQLKEVKNECWMTWSQLRGIECCLIFTQCFCSSSPPFLFHFPLLYTEPWVISDCCNTQFHIVIAWGSNWLYHMHHALDSKNHRLYRNDSSQTLNNYELAQIQVNLQREKRKRHTTIRTTRLMRMQRETKQVVDRASFHTSKISC